MKRIYLHGLGQTAQSWNDVIRASSSDGSHQTLDLIDMIDSAESTYKQLYTKLAAYLSKEKEPFELCGLSLGAVLALNYAIKHPKKVSSLVLIAPQYRMPKTLLKIQNMVFRLMPESKFKETGLSKQSMIALCDSMKDLDFSGSLAKVNSPTLIICGQKDSANMKQARKMADSMPSAVFKSIDDAGHEINAEAPALLAMVLDEFFRKASQDGLHGNEPIKDQKEKI